MSTGVGLCIMHHLFSAIIWNQANNSWPFSNVCDISFWGITASVLKILVTLCSFVRDKCIPSHLYVSFFTITNDFLILKLVQSLPPLLNVSAAHDQSRLGEPLKVL